MGQLEEVCKRKRGKSWIDGTIMWFEYFENKQELFSVLFSSKKTNLFLERLLRFMMNELSEKISLQGEEKNVIYTHFFAVAILGILESLLLNQLPIDVKTAAIQVGKLLEKNLSAL